MGHSAHRGKANIDLPEGAKVKQYRIVRCLGAGGMGEVYLADDTSLNRQVALKFLGTDVAPDKELRQRLTDEARAAASLNHPGIITIFEVGEFQSRPYFAMEFAPGKPLDVLIKTSPLSVAKTLDIAVQVADGLKHAHLAGVIHRDIKPHNIIVDDDGHAKILDFGLARYLDAPETKTGGSLAGTLGYMSPEQVNGEPVGQATDIFSLGAVIYQMLAGKPPFEGEYEAALLYSVVYKNPPPLTKLRSDVPESLTAVISKAMAKSPGQRHQTADELLGELIMLKEAEQPQAASGRPRPTLTSVAVLQFADLSPEKDQQYFCDGIAEELINILTRIKGLRVAARTSAFQFKGQDVDIRKIGQALNVDSVLEGSVRKAGNRLRITVQLVNVADGYHLWSEKYDRDLEDVFAVQDEISAAVAEKLKVRLMGDSGEPVTRRHTTDLEAFNLHLKGRYFWNKRYEGGLQTSIQYFKQAIDRDPTYAEAYAGLADAFNICGYYNFLAPHDACPRARAAAQKALEIDPGLTEGHTALGWNQTFYEWDWEGGEASFLKAIALNPGYAISHHYYALHLLARKRFEQGIEEMQLAQKLDPLSLIINTCVGAAHYFNRDHDTAIEHYRKTLELDPNFVLAHAFYAGPLVSKEMWQEATEECQRAGALAGGSTYATAFLAYVFAVSGKSEDAGRLLQELLQRSEQMYVSSSYIGMVYIGMNDYEEAFRWLNKACEEHDNWMAWLDVYPVFDCLRADPRFEQLRRKVGLD